MEIKNYKGILFFDEKGNKDTLLAKGNDFQEVILKTENYQFVQPIAFNESVYQFAETEKAEKIGVSLKIQLFYKEGITIRYEDSNNNVVAEYVITEKNVFSEKMLQIVTFLREGSEKDFAIEVSLITLALENKIWNTKEIKTDFVEDKDMPEQTAYEQIDFLSPSTEELDTVIKSMQYNSDGLTLIESRKATVFIGETALSVNFQREKGNNRISIVKKDLTGKLFESPIITNESLLEIQEIYYNLLKQIVDYLEKTPDKTPDKTPFQQIDFLNPSTEENDVLIKTMSFYSDGLTFVNGTLANLKFNIKGRLANLSVLFDQVNNIIKISEPSKNINVWSTVIQQKISNENITEITNLYFKTLEKFVEIAEAENPDETPEKPNPKFKIGDFVVNKKTTKILKVIGLEDDKGLVRVISGGGYDDSETYYSTSELNIFEKQPKFKVGDRVTFNKLPFATFRVMEEPKYNSEKGKFVYRLANEDGKSSFSASYEDEMNLIVVETPMDCDADPNLIVSGQVKAFYDLNKNRIDKLNSKFSCKIIKALVSLSEYEKCGSPSSATVTKAKTDLLSKISKLKV